MQSVRRTRLALALSVVTCCALACAPAPDEVELIPALRGFGPPEGCTVASPAEPASGAPGPGDAPGDLTLVVGTPDALAEQYTRPRWLNFVPIRHAATVSADGVEVVQAMRKSEHWTPEATTPLAEMGIYEVTVFPCETALAPGQAQEANRLVTESRAAAERHGWFDYDRAIADGFHRMGGISDHWVHDGFATDGRILDPDRPEFLMFHEVGGKKVLTGYMYIMPDIDLRGPQVGGPLTIWHYHRMPAACYEHGIVVEYPDGDGPCTRGVKSEKSSEMLHVWFIDRVDGPFASDMTPPEGASGGHEHHHGK